MKKISYFAFLILTGVFCISGCKSLSSSDESESVREISISKSSPWNYWYEITLRRDGTTQYSGDVSPERKGEVREGKAEINETSRVNYRGKISAEEFQNLSELIIKNDFRKLTEKPLILSGGITTKTSVVFSDGRKEISDQTSKKGDNLFEINEAVDRAISEIEWEREK